MDKLFKTKFYHVQTNKRKKTLKVTNKHFNTRTEGIQLTKTGMILKPIQIQAMLADGWKEYKEPWKPLNLEGDSKVEAEIKAYELKMKRKERMEQAFKKVEPVEPFNYDKKWAKYINKKKEELKVV